VSVPDTPVAGAPRSVGVVGEVLRGAGLLSRGFTVIARRPRLFGLGVLPPLVTSTLFVIILVVLITHIDQLTTALTPWAGGWGEGLATAVRVLVGVGILGGAVLLMVVSFTTLTLALGSPLYDKLSEAVEREFGPVPEYEEPVSQGAVRALRQSAALIAVSLGGAILLFGVGLVPLL
jgi:CysZ protein